MSRLTGDLSPETHVLNSDTISRFRVTRPAMAGRLGGERETKRRDMGFFKEIRRRAQPLFARGETARILAEGVPATAIVRAITDDTRPRGSASLYRMGLDLEVRQGSRQPYRVANDYLMPSDAEMQVGTELPVRIDADDPAAIAIDWDNAPKKPAQGEIRPA